MSEVGGKKNSIRVYVCVYVTNRFAIDVSKSLCTCTPLWLHMFADHKTKETQTYIRKNQNKKEIRHPDAHEEKAYLTSLTGITKIWRYKQSQPGLIGKK